MREAKLLQSVVSEYKSIVPTRTSKRVKPVNTERLVRKLGRVHNWTDNGARAVVSLANDYGAFMLRNALALAIVLEKEDGDLNF